MLHRLREHGRRQRSVNFDNGRVSAHDAFRLDRLHRPDLRISVVRVIELAESRVLPVWRGGREVRAGLAGSPFFWVD